MDQGNKQVLIEEVIVAVIFVMLLITAICISFGV